MIFNYSYLIIYKESESTSYPPWSLFLLSNSPKSTPIVTSLSPIKNSNNNYAPNLKSITKNHSTKCSENFPINLCIIKIIAKHYLFSYNWLISFISI